MLQQRCYLLSLIAALSRIYKLSQTLPSLSRGLEALGAKAEAAVWVGGKALSSTCWAFAVTPDNQKLVQRKAGPMSPRTPLAAGVWMSLLTQRSFSAGPEASTAPRP